MIFNSTIGKMGRAGNMFFQLAGLIGVARRSGQDWGLLEPLTNHDHKERFGSTEDVELAKYFAHPMPIIQKPAQFDRMDYGFGWSDRTLPYGNWDLFGHFQSDKFFKDHIDEVRYYLTMHGEKPVDATAIHFRFGDYSSQIGYHPVQPLEYFQKALEYVPHWQDKIVFSDDNEKAKEIMDQLGVECRYHVGDYLDAFKVMKCCQNFICANSSFSLMAAILQPNPDKIVAVPRLWWGPSWGANHIELTKDVPPEGSIVI